MLNYKRYTIAIAKEIRLQLMKPVLCSLKDAQYRLKESIRICTFYDSS